MEQQAWYLRSLVEQLDRQEAEDEEAPNGSAAEFAVSYKHVTLLKCDVEL